MNDVEKMTLVQLRGIAKEQGLKNLNKMKKSELIASLIKERTLPLPIEEVEQPEACAAPIEVETVTVVERSDRITGAGILEIMADGYGFLRSQNFMRGENDIYVSISQIKDLTSKQETGLKVTLESLKKVKKLGRYCMSTKSMEIVQNVPNIALILKH